MAINRILFIDRRIAFNIGGGEQVDLMLARSLQQRGYEVFFLVSHGLFTRGRSSFGDLKTIEMRCPYLVSLWQRLPSYLGVLVNIVDILIFDTLVMWRIETLVARYGIDAIEVASIPSLAYKLQKRFPTKRVICQFAGPLGWFFYRYHTKRLHYLFAPDDAYRKLKKLNPEIKRISTGVDDALFVREAQWISYLHDVYGIGREKKIILSVGRFVPLKNYQYLLDVLQSLKRNGVSFVHVFIGEGPLLEKMKKKSREYSLENDVVFLGRIENGELPKFYNSASVFLLTSLYENSPTVIKEALACGLPVVATDVGGVRDIISDDEAVGFRVPLNNAELAARAVENILKNRDLEENLRKNALLLAGRDFSFSKSVDLFESYFLKIYDKR